MASPSSILSDDQRADLMEQLTAATPDAGRIIAQALSGEIQVKNEKLVDIAGDLLDRVGVPKMKYQTVEHRDADLSPEAAQHLLKMFGAMAEMFGLSSEARTIRDVTGTIKPDDLYTSETPDPSHITIEHDEDGPPPPEDPPPPSNEYDPDLLEHLK